MFGLINAALRAFVVGAVVGVLFAPRAGVETRRMLNERIAAMINQLLEIAALPPIEPTQAATNGHTERPAVKRARSAEGPGARTTT
ncbi:MAG: hypothetical protein ABI466_03375 [Chloroflexota bacterium]